MVSRQARESIVRSLFIVGLCMLAAVSVLAPSWAAKLAQQGYYADFELELINVQPLVAAGASMNVLALVRGRGPDIAQSATITLRGDVGLTAGSSPGCGAVSPQSTLCALPAIAPNDLFIRTAKFESHADARGIRVISGFVSSELLPTPTDPGLGVDAVAVELFGAHSTEVRLFDVRPIVLPDMRLSWAFIVDNQGPSSLLVGRLVLIAEPGATQTCTPSGNARCQIESGDPLYLPPGGQLMIEVIAPAIVPPATATTVTLRLLRQEGTDTGLLPGAASASFQVNIFADSFGE